MSKQEKNKRTSKIAYMMNIWYLDVAQLYGSKPDIVKEVFGNLLSLLIDAARLDLDADKLGIALTSAKMTGQRVNKLCETYANSKELIKSSLRRIGNSLPHVIDVNWRLDYCVKVYN